MAQEEAVVVGAVGAPRALPTCFPGPVHPSFRVCVLSPCSACPQPFSEDFPGFTGASFQQCFRVFVSPRAFP